MLPTCPSLRVRSWAVLRCSERLNTELTEVDDKMSELRSSSIREDHPALNPNAPPPPMKPAPVAAASPARPPPPPRAPSPPPGPSFRPPPPGYKTQRDRDIEAWEAGGRIGPMPGAEDMPSPPPEPDVCAPPAAPAPAPYVRPPPPRNAPAPSVSERGDLVLSDMTLYGA